MTSPRAGAVKIQKKIISNKQNTLLFVTHKQFFVLKKMTTHFNSWFVFCEKNKQTKQNKQKKKQKKKQNKTNKQKKTNKQTK